MIERWRDIPGYEGRYRVSDAGQVMSLPNSRRKTELLMKRTISADGYWAVNLTKSEEGRWKQRVCKVHQLVMLAFEGEPPEGMTVCHNDGDRLNARLDNLRYDTHAENMRDKYRHGTNNTGTQNPSAKLTEEQVLEVKQRLDIGERVGDLAKEFGVVHGCISAINTGRNWNNLGIEK